MRFPTLILTLLVLWSLSSGAPAVLQDHGQKTPTNQSKPLYQPTGNEATLTGSIIANGEVPRIMRYDMSADPVCEKLSVDHHDLDDLLISDQRVVNTFVYIKGGELNSYRFEVPDAEVELAHKGCYYSPRILGIRAGQRLSIVNNDPTTHNTHPTPVLNPEWNMSQAVGSTPFVKTFTRAEQFIPVKDNHHPWERAIIGVFDHPFFAVSDQFGNYEIRGLPPGKYKLVAWHERLGEQEMEITIVPGESRKIDFTFDLAKRGSRME
jgi:plastocyanin